MWTDTSCRTRRFHHIGECRFSNWWITIPDASFLRVEFCWQFPWSLDQAVQLKIKMFEEIFNCFDVHRASLISREQSWQHVIKQFCFSFQAYVDKAFNREILELDVKCNNHEWGCKWEGQFQNAKVYIREKMSLRHAKDLFESTGKMERELKHLFNGTCKYYCTLSIIQLVSNGTIFIIAVFTRYFVLLT